MGRRRQLPSKRTWLGVSFIRVFGCQIRRRARVSSGVGNTTSEFAHQTPELARGWWLWLRGIAGL